jgi:hypothetical protein
MFDTKVRSDNTSCVSPGAPNNPPVAGAGAPKMDVVGAGVGAFNHRIGNKNEAMTSCMIKGHQKQ